MKLIQYVREAQFHGAKRLADTKFRWLWVCGLLLFLVAAVSSVVGAVNRFLDNPTHMIQLDNPKALLFPSVTICPEILFSEEKMDQFIAEIVVPNNMNMTLIRNSLRGLAAFHTPGVPYSFPHLQMLESVLQLNGISTRTALWKLTASCDEMLLRCRLFKEIVNCTKLFTKMFTKFGYCCVFNGKSIRKAQGDAVEVRVKPKAPGFTHHLMVAVSQPQPLRNLLSSKWFTVQHPQQYVEASFNSTPLLPRTEHWAGYMAHRMMVGVEAKKLGDDLLNCRMTEERLRFFPIYKKIYCHAECAMERIRKQCGCVGLSYPSLPGVVQCRVRNLHCLIHAAGAYDSPDCDCPKPCDLTQSEVHIQTFNLIQGTPSIDPFYDGLDLNRVSVVRAFALHRNTRIQQRRSFYDFTNLFSQLGGMFNVYLGCSVLTLVEMLQMIWHSIKSWWNKRRVRQRKSLEALKRQKTLVAVNPQKMNGFRRKYQIESKVDPKGPFKYYK